MVMLVGVLTSSGQSGLRLWWTKDVVINSVCPGVTELKRQASVCEPSPELDKMLLMKAVKARGLQQICSFIHLFIFKSRGNQCCILLVQILLWFKFLSAFSSTQNLLCSS